MYFHNISRVNGLSHDKINCILQDSRGFVWIGTDDGLNRYDGDRFQVFRKEPQNNSGLSGNIIADLLEDKNGILWIATTDGGLTRYDFRAEPMKQFAHYATHLTDSINANHINTMVEDRSGNIWVGTGGEGVLRFEKKTGKFHKPFYGRFNTILDLALDSNGWIWAGRQGGGLMIIDPMTLKVYEDRRYSDVYAKLPHMVVASIFRDSENNIWLGSWDKVIYRQNFSKGKKETFFYDGREGSFQGDDPLAFAEDKGKRIWIGGNYSGLHLYNPSSGKFIQYVHDISREGSLADNKVNCIYIDKSGIAWIGTDRGISIHDPYLQQFTQTFLPSSGNNNRTVYDFITDENSDLLIGCSDGLYIRSNVDGSIRYHPLRYKNESLAITKFFWDNNNHLYLGTNVSLFLFNRQKKSVSLLPNTNDDIVMRRLIESRIVSIIKDTLNKNPVLLVSPYGHFIAYYDLVEERWISRQDTSMNIIKRLDLRDHMIRKFYKCRDGRIWLATTREGLGEWTSDKLEPIIYYAASNEYGDQPVNKHIYDIAEDKNDNLWISTYGGGLFHFDVIKKTFRHIQGSHNLSEGIATDADDNVWIIANGNLHKYDPERNYYSSYQVPDLEKTGGLKGYIYKGKNNLMYVSGENYFVEFDPARIRDIYSQPDVCFTDFKIFNTSFSHLLFNEKIQLKYNQNFFSVEFASPGFYSGYPVQYSHMLEKVDNGWVYDGKQNVVNYTNLDAGIYTFKVRAGLKPGVWSSEISTLVIQIFPPFWKTWWFYTGCFVITTLLVYGIYRYRINEILKRQAIRNKIAQDLHDNVGSTLSSISVYSKVATIYHQQNKEKALGETLEKIISTSSDMISEMNDIVWAINPRNDNLSTILNRMDSYARPLLASLGISFYFEYPEDMGALNLEMTRRKNLYLIFKESVSNAIKYSGCKNLWVKVTVDHHQLTLLVIDDGKGFVPSIVSTRKTLSGNGLQNMQLRTKEMKGVWTITSEEGKGTTIRLSFPIP